MLEGRTVAMLGLATSLTLVVALICELVMMPSLLVIVGYPIDGTEVDRPLHAKAS